MCIRGKGYNYIKGKKIWVQERGSPGMGCFVIFGAEASEECVRFRAGSS